MTVLFQGAEMASFTPSDSTVVEYAPSSGTYANVWDSNFARCCILVDGSAAYCEGTPSASATDIWIHFDLAVQAMVSGSTSTCFKWYDSSGNERLRLNYNDTSKAVSVTYWNGSAFVSAGSFTMEMSPSRQTFDINVVCNSATGLIAAYVAGTERLGAPVINTSSITNLKKFRFPGITQALDTKVFFSQVIVADEPTVGWRLVTRYANGAGATTDWTGDYSAIDETVYNDADFVSSSVADQVELFTNAGHSLTGYSVRSVAVAARAKRGASGPANIRMALRVSSTTYFSSGDIALTVGYTPVQTIWEQDPATTADWLASAITALQFGVKSIT